MTFNINIAENVPISPEADLHEALKMFLTQIGYLKRERDTDTAVNLFKCFILMPEKPWTVEELIAYLETTRPTLYNHLNKLKSMDFLESQKLEVKGFEGKKKVYQLRARNLETAWHFVKFHIDISLKNYDRTIANIWSIARKEREKIPLEETG